MNMGTFICLDGYENEYDTMLKNELDRLLEMKTGTGITYKEDNMIFQIKTHLGIDVDLLSQRASKSAADKDIGIESYN
jgi:hypothetical protein